MSLVMRLRTAVKELVRLVPPPESQREVGTSEEWRAFEANLGCRLPTDYREYVQTYGTGLFANFYLIDSPFAANKYANLQWRIDHVCKDERWLRSQNTRDFPFPIWPERHGILPFASDENGNYYSWLTVGRANSWRVVQNEVRGHGYSQPFDHSMSQFLLAILRKEIEPLAGDYPNSEDFIFKPIGAK